MSQFLAPKALANRRGFLTLAVAAAIVPMSEVAFALDKHTPNTMVVEARRGTQADVRNQKTLQTAACA